jgi:hypothetical protein
MLRNMTNRSGSDQLTDSIIKDLYSLKKAKQTSSVQSVFNQISVIRQKVRTLQDRELLYTMLRQGTVLSTGLGAKGVAHCEAVVLWFLVMMKIQNNETGWEVIVSCLFPLLLSKSS